MGHRTGAPSGRAGAGWGRVPWLALAVLLGATVPATPLSGQRLHYRTFLAATDSTLWRFSVGLVENGEAHEAGEAVGKYRATVIEWRSESGDSHVQSMRVQADGNTAEWSVRFVERGTAYRGVRVDDRLAVSGTIEGHSINREFELDEDPVLYNVPIGLAPFVRSGAQHVDFWTFRPEKQSVIHMNARREATDTLALRGEAVVAVRVRVAPIGWRGLLYSRRFWFRASDGVLLETDERDGRITELTAGG
jgi:hypothetical protein